MAGPEDCREIVLAVDGMHCAACALTVEQLLQQVSGVQSVTVDGPSATARVTWNPAATRPDDWVAPLRARGYDASAVTGHSETERERAAARWMLWRWLVAGFCMMQVMMYAAPLYLAAPGEIAPDMQALLRWAAWTLSVPVMLFSCWPFFQSAVRDLRQRQLGMDVPVALGIAVAFGACTAGTFDPAGPFGHDVWYDAVTMFVFFLLSGRLLEQRLRTHTAGSLQALMRRLPAMAERVRPGGQVERVPVSALAVGDVVQVRPGDAVPADGTVVEGRGHLHEALLTGESRPVPRGVGDTVVAASHSLDALLRVRVDRLGRDTRYAAIVDLMAQAALQRPASARLADRLATPFLALVLLAGLLAALWWWPTDPAHAVRVAVAVLIVTCPCALSLATPAATLAAAGALARRGVLVRRLPALEAAAATDTVLLDKTGTLTEDRLGARMLAQRVGAVPETVVGLAAALAAQSLHPAARAVAALLPDASRGHADAVRETPGAGLEGRVTLAGGSAQTVRLGSAVWCSAGVHHADSGLSQVHVADERGWLGCFALEESLRVDALTAIQRLQHDGLSVQLLSGDRPDAVTRLAGRVGIAQAQAECTPEDKLAHLRSLQSQGKRVAMVGDGMNDGPVLACADLSLAMGDQVPIAQARADVVVLSGRLGAVPELLRLARRTRRVIRQNLAWALAYNLACVPLAITGRMPPWLAGLGMALSSLVVVANAARLARGVGDD